MTMHRILVAFAILVPASISFAAEEMPRWIWISDAPAAGEQAVFDLDFEIPSGSRSLVVRAAVDNEFVLRLDGEAVLRGDDWSSPSILDVSNPEPGRHRLSFECRNESGPAGFAAIIELDTPAGMVRRVSGPDWLVRGIGETADDARVPIDFGSTEAPDGPWNNPFEEKVATPVEAIIVPDGFEIELLHSAQPGEGSWSSMTVDDQGRVILSAQYGPLRRVTPSDSPGGRAKVERLHDTVGRAQGLLLVGDDLYVSVVDDPEQSGGLWRLRDADGDDLFETAERLAAYGNGSEHGPHGLVLGPDGMIWTVIGNYSKHPQPILESSAHANWSEDTVLERIWDPRGHAVGKRAPGGLVLRTDLDATGWEIVAGGFRNPYDLDFTADGELFTYDADMEWDIGAPWYRSPRFIHVVSGGEYGWRAGSVKWPVDSPDARPAALEMDAGSPTGVASGHRSNFPEPWKSRMFLGDWAYGRVLAVDLEADGASHVATAHLFLQGRPFNVTDFAFGPDGAMFLTTGGRGSQSGLYRVRWTGPAIIDPVAPAKVSSAILRRRALEASHRDATAIAREELFGGLGDADPAIRYAARIGVERGLLAARYGEPGAFTESDDDVVEALLELPADAGGWDAAIAIMRVGDRAEAIGGLGRIQVMAEDDQTDFGRRQLARVLGLLITRHGPLEPDAGEQVVAMIESIYPTGVFETDRVLVEVLVALDAPSVVGRTLPLIEMADRQETAILFLHALRLQQSGWDEDSRRRIMAALDRAKSYSGGASLPGFIAAIRSDFAKTLGPAAAESLAAREAAMKEAEIEAEVRAFVRAWSVDDFSTHLARVHAGRDHARGAQMFEALQCAACHKVGDVGVAYGPDLTGVGGRFSAHDLLIAIIDPARDLSDQYAGVLVERGDADPVIGLPIAEEGGVLAVAPDPRTGTLRVEIPLEEITSRTPVTPMAAGLLDTASMDEILDLLAYMRSGGDPADTAFKRPP
jgi:putative heme-binding domain-containing protein